jgi:hypothetical protein
MITATHHNLVVVMIVINGDHAPGDALPLVAAHESRGGGEEDQVHHLGANMWVFFFQAMSTLVTLLTALLLFGCSLLAFACQRQCSTCVCASQPNETIHAALVCLQVTGALVLQQAEWPGSSLEAGLLVCRIST